MEVILQKREINCRCFLSFLAPIFPDVISPGSPTVPDERSAKIGRKSPSVLKTTAHPRRVNVDYKWLMSKLWVLFSH